MSRIQLKSEVLLLCLVCLALLPFAFIGLDFTDSGYHFINQKLMFSDKGILQNNAFYWLSDFLAALVQSIFPWKTFLFFRLLGVGVWGLTALIFFRFFLLIHHQMTKMPPNFFLLSWCLAISIALSAKPFIEGILLIPDYYTIPVLLMSCLFYSMYRYELSQKVFYFWLTLGLFVSLPLARWPLVFSAVILLVFWAFNSTAQRKIFLFLGGYVLAAVGYQQKFLSQFYSSEQQGNQMLKVLSRYVAGAGELFLTGFLCFGIVLFFRALSRYSKMGRRKDLLLSAGLIVLLYVAYSEYFSAKEFYRSGLVFLMAFGAGWLWFRTSGKAKAISLSLALASGTYFVGSDTGLVKAAYLAFFVGAPTSYLFLLDSAWAYSRRWILIPFASIVAIAHLWGGLYRDSWKEILQEPAVVRDDFIGWALTGKGKAKVITELKTAIIQVPTNVDHVLISPNSPLLSIYLRPRWIHPGLLWSEIKSTHFVLNEWIHLCGERRETFRIAILSGSNDGPQKGSGVTGSCHWRTLLDGNTLFLEKMVYDQGTGGL